MDSQPRRYFSSHFYCISYCGYRYNRKRDSI